jgi:CTP synthase
VAGLDGAHSTEFNSDTPHPVIALIAEWQDMDGTLNTRDAESELGGTMRLGAQDCLLEPNTRALDMYGSAEIRERHRHRFEFNNLYMQQLRDAGLMFSGFSADGLVEMIELPDHMWFVACQFHPEFCSTPRDGHPLFTGFVAAARQYSAEEPRAAAQA